MNNTGENRNNEDHKHGRHDDKGYREYLRWRRSFRNPWVWICIAALIIVPVTVYGWIQHDNYKNGMLYKGCRIVNTFESGSNVWSCPKQVK